MAAGFAPISTGFRKQDERPDPDSSRSIAELTLESLEQARSPLTAGRFLADSLFHHNTGPSHSTLDVTRKGHEAGSNGRDPVIEPDLTDYVYHEDDEGEADDASIQHDSDTISVAGYQDHPLPLSKPKSNQDLTLQTHRALPTHLNDLLEQWYARHGRAAPNCVCKRTEAAMAELWHLQKSSTPVTWLHRSGSALNVTWYYLPGNQVRNDGNSLKLIVVSGPNLAPSIVAYQNAGGRIAGIEEPGVVYKIWRGLAGDKDGFEFSPSVIKMSRAIGKPNLAGTSTRRAVQPSSLSFGFTVSASTLRCERCTIQHLGCDRKQPTCSRCASKGKSCHYDDATVPKPESMEVNMEAKGDTMDLQRSERARRPANKYTSEGHAPIRKRKLEETSFDQEDDDDSDALLSKFMSHTPQTSMASGSSLRASKSKPWVCYLCGDASTNKKDMRFHFRQVHGLNPEETRMRWTGSRGGTQNAQTFVIAPNAREAPAATRAAGVEAAESISDVGTTPEAGPVQQQAPRRTFDQRLEEHMKKNVKIIFFSRTQPPRARPLSYCDASHKLFAQATAGGVFSREHARVLAVEVEDQEGELPIVEDDAEDFAHFVKQLRNALCWTIRNGQIEGDMWVHIREKRL